MKLLIYPIVVICGIFIANRENPKSENLSSQRNLKDRNLQKDTLITHINFSSEYVDNRNVEVWLPKGYSPNSEQKYKVLYVHDGQNVFNNSTAFGNIEWGIDETLDSLIQEKEVAPTIVVAIWNNGHKRFPEYMPQVNEVYTSTPQAQAILKSYFGVDQLLSDAYLKFIVEELKPFIDSTYNTSIVKEDTAIMGSSMGGLISLYAISEFPNVFGAAGCISTHWPVPLIGEAYIEDLGNNLPDPQDHKIYFDYGTETLDAEYEPYQKRVDEIMKLKGFQENENWITRKFEGAAHNEQSWKKRAHIPLKFILQ